MAIPSRALLLCCLCAGSGIAAGCGPDWDSLLEPHELDTGLDAGAATPATGVCLEEAEDAVTHPGSSTFLSQRVDAGPAPADAGDAAPPVPRREAR